MLSFTFLLISAATLTLAQEDFFMKYTFAKTMSQCFGDSAYEEYLLMIAKAKRECSGQSSYTDYTSPRPFYNPNQNTQFTSVTFRPPPPNRPFDGGFLGNDNRNPLGNRNPGRFPIFSRPSNKDPELFQGRFPSTKKPLFTVVTSKPINSRPSNTRPDFGPQQPFINNDQLNFLPNFAGVGKSQHSQDKLYDAVAINSAIQEISDALRNFTCVLGRLQLIDQYLNIQYDMMIQNYYRSNIDDQLREDLIAGLNYCQQISSCLPEDKSPVSLELQRLMAFIKCEKKTRLSACFKQDLRNNLHHFDTSALPDDNMRTTDLEKLMTILIGPESLDQLELF